MMVRCESVNSEYLGSLNAIICNPFSLCVDIIPIIT